MAIKKPKKGATAESITLQQVDILANQLVDKPYGKSSDYVKKRIDSEIARTTISLPKCLLETIEDIALNNKRMSEGSKTVSGIVREALEKYLETSGN